MTDFVVDAILLGLLLLILLAFFIFRKRIRRASQKARERRAAQQAVQPTAAYTASDSQLRRRFADRCVLVWKLLCGRNGRYYSAARPTGSYPEARCKVTAETHFG